MSFRRRSGSSWPDIGNIRRRSGSSWVQVEKVRRRVGSSWVEVWTNYVPLDGDRSTISGNVFMPEPAPVQTSVSATGSAGATGGTGSYTYVWTIISGPAAIIGSNTNASVSITATVSKNNIVSGTIRCQISDGVSSINIDRGYSLSYFTDL